MNITIDVNLKASEEVTNSLLTLAAVLHNAVPIFDESPKEIKPKEVKKEVQAPKEELKDKKEKSQKQESKKAEEAIEITLEEVRGILAKLSKDGKQSEVKALIKKFGGKKLTDISKDKYSELLKEAEMI
ncbi:MULTISPECIES: rRNA biogenesis protein rrp5 [unclassified Clostridium]|uniref:rRNA biogenesis protein rrp5 n=1 Tax=unclassified Clostridium TaxID=2614128 RepID=UPI003F8D9A42